MSEREQLAATARLANDLRIPGGVAYLLLARMLKASRGESSPDFLADYFARYVCKKN